MRQDRTRPPADRVLGLALILAPVHRRNWVRAMAAEAAHEDRLGSGLMWRAGGLSLALRLAATEGRAVFLACLAGALAGLVRLDWLTVRTPEVLTLLFIVTAMMGYWRPRAFLWIGMLFGSCLLAAHAASNLTGWARPFYQWKALSITEWLVIAAIAPPAMAAAAAGAALRRNPACR